MKIYANDGHNCHDLKTNVGHQTPYLVCSISNTGRWSSQKNARQCVGYDTAALAGGAIYGLEAK